MFLSHSRLSAHLKARLASIPRPTVFVTIVLMALFLSGCASTPKVHSVYEQGVNFHDYKTYSFLSELTPQGEEAYLSLADKYLMDAIRTELNKRGLKEVAKGELLVGFEVTTKEKIRSTTTSFGWGYYGFRSRWGYNLGWAPETHINQYTEGTLTIDVVDAAKKQVIWEGVSVGRLKQPEQNNLRAKTYEVVEAIFSEYPVVASVSKVTI